MIASTSLSIHFFSLRSFSVDSIKAFVTHQSFNTLQFSLILHSLILFAINIFITNNRLHQYPSIPKLQQLNTPETQYHLSRSQNNSQGINHCQTISIGRTFGSKCSTIRVSPTLSFRLLTQLITTHPAEQPALGGSVSSPGVQQAHPWIKNQLLPHVSACFQGLTQKAQGRSTV